MKKLILSAFAMSLMVLNASVFGQSESVDDFLDLDKVVVPKLKGKMKSQRTAVKTTKGPSDPEQEFLDLESEVTPRLEGKQRFTTEELHTDKEWKVRAEAAEVDLPEPNKGQGYSIIPWSKQDPEEWLSIDNWLIDRKVKDKHPDWKIRLRQDDLKELVGKVLKCVGECEVYRGINAAKVQHLSRIHEGDEIRIGKNSYAWIYIMDGSLMRLSPETSISVNEINFGTSYVFIEARLNQGHIFWHPRNKKDMKVEYAPETDSGSLPLMVRESNLQHFERVLYQSKDDAAHLAEVMVLDDNAVNEQFKKINNLKAESNPHFTVPTRVMIVSPNSTLVSKEVSFDFVFLAGGKSFLKKRNTEENEEFSLHLRGYTATEVQSISEEVWHEVESNGRSYSKIEDVPGQLQVMELLTKRIKTIELAREIWVREFTIPVLQVRNQPEILAREHGYTSWGDDLEKRFNFLVEYTRRIETTNLRAIENLLTKIEATGKVTKRDLTEDFYQASLNHYLLGLKSRYDNKKMRVREMTDLQFYIWILNNGKF